MESYDIFAKNLQELMDRKGIYASELARMLGCSRSVVSDWLKGRKLPRMDKVEAMCEIFHCRRSDLLEEHSVEDKKSEIYEKRKILFDMSGKCTQKQLDKFIAMMQIEVEDDD